MQESDYERFVFDDTSSLLNPPGGPGTGSDSADDDDDGEAENYSTLLAQRRRPTGYVPPVLPDAEDEAETTNTEPATGREQGAIGHTRLGSTRTEQSTAAATASSAEEGEQGQ